MIVSDAPHERRELIDTIVQNQVSDCESVLFLLVFLFYFRESLCHVFVSAVFRAVHQALTY